jgi:hypothetical protein
MEITSTYYVAGANSDTPLTVGSGSAHRQFVKLAEDSIFGSQDHLVIVDMNENAKRIIQTFNLRRSQCSLIRQEPAVVCPANFSTFAVNNFSKIIDVGRKSVDSTLSVPWPQTLPPKPPKAFNVESRIAAKPVLMNANKLSFVSGELYSLRRKLIHVEPLALYGPSWDSNIGHRIRTLAGEALIFSKSQKKLSRSALSEWFNQHPNYMGIADVKSEVLSQFKVAVAIENSPEYMSEKLLDAILAGCIPVYVGPSVADFGIPHGLVLESEPNVAAISKAITQAKEMDYDSWAERALTYLENPLTFSYWSPERIFSEISQHIQHE